MRHVPPPLPPVLEEFKRACGLLSFSSRTLTHTLKQTHPAQLALAFMHDLHYRWSQVHIS